MTDSKQRVHIESLDWLVLFPFLHIFKSFRMAIRPGKLFLALLLSVLLYIGGNFFDFVWGPQVYPGEVDQYIHQPRGTFESWLDAQRSDPKSELTEGIFGNILASELEAFERLIASATSLDFGFRTLLSDDDTGLGGVLGALRTMVISIPSWLYCCHPGFLAVYLTYTFFWTALIGGAISRQAALQAGRSERISAFESIRFTAGRYLWYVLAPVIPAVIALVIGLLLALSGLVLFNLPVTDIAGGALFGLMLFGGFLIALLLIGLAAGGNLLYPSLAVEGTDAFDAISRCYNYVLGRPWRFLFYTAVMIVYGAIGYVFVGLVVFLTLWVTKAFVGLWAFTDLSGEAVTMPRFDAILPDPQLGLQALFRNSNSPILQTSGFAMVSAWLVMVWVKLLIALMPAFAVSYYFSAQTWIYLLLRQASDGSGLDDIYQADTGSDRPMIPADKVEVNQSDHT